MSIEPISLESIYIYRIYIHIYQIYQSLPPSLPPSLVYFPKEKTEVLSIIEERVSWGLKTLMSTD